ncbi:GNAT family N-acetyltransferase [Pinibacter aurantiacus]|uniref:GNAT family N-acetyltransferase n=1 Tax=Pinibacter aurantiacus TaxID=2851599 RepID=A0A9E2W9G2_9BACT|nr:GNAT family N-acetyltransferase [Pinibacter aurantiacus]MBV4359627.1 GNAT family N-acetyltransferase [Pinibacter aurantiacus]
MISIEKITDHNGLDLFLQLTKEYLLELGEDLSFQSVQSELEEPLLKYGPPKGLILLAFVNGEVAGCIALQAILPHYHLSAAANRNAYCEMKRMYVKPAFRKHGIGNVLVEELLKEAKQLGYTHMWLDTLSRMQAAINLYKRHGFNTIDPYYHNPLPGVIFMEAELPNLKI